MASSASGNLPGMGSTFKLPKASPYHGGMPVAPKRKSLLDPETGMLQEQYQMQPGTYQGPTAINMPTPLEQRGTSVGLGELQKMATTPAMESDWYKRQSELVATQQAGLREQAERAGAGMQAETLAALGTSGGFGSGARERAARAGSRMAMAERQQAARYGAGQQAGLGAQAEQLRMQAVGQLTPAEQAQSQYLTGIDQANQAATQQANMFNMGNQMRAGMFNVGQENMAQQANIRGAMGEHQQQYGSGMSEWMEQMKAWAAGKQAKATAASGKGGK